MTASYSYRLLGHVRPAAERVESRTGCSWPVEVECHFRIQTSGVAVYWRREGGTHSAKLLGGDGAITVLVEEGECLLEFSDLFLGKLVSHCCVCKDQRAG